MGRSLLADRDHLLSPTRAGALLLLHIPPGDYPFEQHACSEFIVCLDGQMQLEADHGTHRVQVTASVGQMIEVPPDVRHRFGPASDGVLLTLAQRP